MPLPNLANNSGGDFDPYLSFNAKAGRWYSKPEGGGEQYEVTNMTAVFDFPNIKTGWFAFAEGSAPEKVFDPSLTQAAPKPANDRAKRGFEVKVFSEKNIGGVREFSSTAGVAIEAINAVYDAWENAAESKDGKLPVIKCRSVTPVKTKHGTNYAPVLEIVSWVDRPEELAGSNDNPAAASKPQPTGGHVPPPVAKTPVTADDDVDF